MWLRQTAQANRAAWCNGGKVTATHEVMMPPVSGTRNHVHGTGDGARRSSGMMRVGGYALACVAAIMMSMAPQHADAAAKKKSKSKTRVQSIREVRDITSALIIDADTGKVIYAEDATELRYPASLTKMMTLYLTFDAIKRGDLKLNQKMYVSAHAASMPATNLALKAGDYLPVEDAIRALVVRSANDAAVVLGETIGGSEQAFGAKMTAKARELGMLNTTFRNASGLPNKEQQTTARDLALLAMALQKHFPQYYHYFKTTQFAYNGRTYTTHNRVLLNYPGCDGLKTGFINASGFNLVSSVHRNDRHLIGVVMGGSSGASRDKQMMALFDRALGVSGAPFRTVDAAPKPAVQSSSAKQLAEVSPFKPMPKVKPHPDADDTARVLAQSVEKAQVTNAISAPARSVEVASLTGIASAHAATTPANPTLSDAMTAHAIAAPSLGKPVTSPTLASNGGWGIQVGAFGGRDEAAAAAKEALAQLPNELAHAQAMAPQSQSGGAVHRARLGNLSEQEARSACRKMLQMNKACFVFQAN